MIRALRPQRCGSGGRESFPAVLRFGIFTRGMKNMGAWMLLFELPIALNRWLCLLAIDINLVYGLLDIMVD